VTKWVEYWNKRAGFLISYPGDVYFPSDKKLDKALFLYPKTNNDSPFGYEISILVLSKKEEKYISPAETEEEIVMGGIPAVMKFVDGGKWGKPIEVRVKVSDKVVQFVLVNADNKEKLERFTSILETFRVFKRT
jgi:hypothetical protein